MGVVWAACAAGESLWLDELHTSWTVSGEWSEVAARARQGNQSPLYFAGLFGAARTLGNLEGIPGELLLRFPSVLCWGATLFVCLHIIAQAGRPRRAEFAIGWRSGFGDAQLAMGAAIVLWLLIDRIQLFYATEARVYAMVQLVSLLAWCCIGRLAVCDGRETIFRSILLWCGLSVLLISLHLTAVLACGWQMACGTWIIFRRHPQLRLAWTVAVTVVLVALAAALQFSSQLWEHRYQWSSFAGDATWSTLAGLFPLAAYLTPVAVAWGVDRLCSFTPLVKPRGHRPAHPESDSLVKPRGHCPARPHLADRGPARGPLGRRFFARGPLGTRFNERGPLGRRFSERREGSCQQQCVDLWLWWVAAAGPWLSGWCITSLGIAPIYHRRFVIVAAIPLLLVAATQLAHIRRPSLRWLAVIGVAAWLAASQGTLDNWRAGSWYGWQRAEGWRQASQFLRAHIKPGDAVWCCSGLIEASGARLPLSDSLDRYLSFPLRGLYRIDDWQGDPLVPRALIGDGASWRKQLLSARTQAVSSSQEEQGRGEGDIEQSLAGEEPFGGEQWIVYRGNLANFKRHLQLLRQGEGAQQPAPWQIGSPRSFGLVCLVRISDEGITSGE